MEEEWRDIESFEGIYQVSNLGKVRRVEHLDKINSCYGTYYRKKSEYYFKLIESQNYQYVQLHNKNYLVHRLVASAFVPNPENKPFVHHKDRNTHNNCADNLEWVTHQENMDYAVAEGFLSNDSRKKLSESHRRLWQDAEYRNNHIQKLKLHYEDPDFCQRNIDNMKKYMSDPAHRYQDMISQPNRIRIKCIEDDKIFESIGQASRYYNLDHTNISDAIHSNRTIKRKYTFVEI